MVDKTLDRFALLGGLGGTLLVKVIAYKLAIRHRGSNLPPGAVVLDSPLPEIPSASPSTWWSLVGTGVAILTGWSFATFAIIASIFDLWGFIPPFLFLTLPVWVNWVGIILTWITDVVCVAVVYYNVNFTLASKGIKGNYVLATGGPYKRVRHPMYIALCICAISIFLATELWPALLSISCWGAVRSQATKEEDLMRKTFRGKYEHYYPSTGRFFPKLTRKLSIEKVSPQSQ